MSLFLSERAGLIVLAAGFAGLFAHDVWTVRRGEAPSWYGSLRWQLTVAVVLALLAAALPGVSSARAQGSASQPEVVCDLGPLTVGAIEAGKLRTREVAETLRLTFRDIDPKAGTAKATIGEGASGVEFAAVTVDPNAITYLVERSGVFKLVLATGNRPTAEGWPAMMS